MLALQPLVDAVHAIEGALKQDPPNFSRERLDLLFEAAAALRRAVEQAGTNEQDAAFGRLSGLELPRRLEADTVDQPPAATPAPPDAPAPGPQPAAEAGPPQAGPPQAGAAEPEAPEPESGAAVSESAAPRAESAEPDSGDGAGEFLRVPFSKLDEMLDQVGELTSVTAAFRVFLDHYEDELDNDGLEAPLAELVEQLGRVARALRGSTMEARLVPVQRVFSRFPSLARDLAREQNKRVRMLLEGGDVQLDRSMVDALGDPLLHLVRNAVDHGIRPPEEREAAGRPATGTIVLRAARRGDRVRVEVQDDGPGLDPEAIRRTAIRRGIIAEGTTLSEDETADLVFRPGFSTRASSDTVSGRGIGLDAVKERVTTLRGALSVERPEEGGTRFVLDLPLTLAILPALVFETDGGIFAVPALSVERTLRGATPERAGAAEVLRLDGELIPVARAGRVFGWHERSGEAPDGRADFAVVVRSGSRRGALLASRLVEQRDLVVKALPAYLGRVPAVSGASIAPDGAVVLLLDPAGLLDLNLTLHQEHRALTTT